MLKVNDLHVSYGAIQAIKGVTLEVNDGEIVSLIGANGAGKSTILRTITGLVSATSGSILYDNHDLVKIEPSKIVGLGMAHVPEGRHIFARMSVTENLLMGAFIRRNRAAIDASLDRVYQSFPRLKERSKQIAGTLSGGEQQMLAMGRALMSDPKILLLDEPSMGLSPILVQEVFAIIKSVHDLGITVLLVEQNARMALSIASRAYVLETGNITMQDDADKLMNDDRVRRAYLGV